MLFIIFIKDLDGGLEGTLRKFADDTNLRGPVDSLKGREAVERGLNELEDWMITNSRQFNQGTGELVLDSAPGMGQSWMYGQIEE